MRVLVAYLPLEVSVSLYLFDYCDSVGSKDACLSVKHHRAHQLEQKEWDTHTHAQCGLIGRISKDFSTDLLEFKGVAQLRGVTWRDLKDP